jgi:drug/metabolite transporter (DMT)-like permease
MLLRGIALMIAGSGLLTANDAFMKVVLAEIPVTQAIFVRSVLVGAVFIIIRGKQTYASLRDPAALKSQVLCAALLALSILLFTGSLSELTLATATTAFYLSPVLVVLLAPHLIGEVPSKEKIIASVFGLLGVGLVVLKPGTAFSWMIVLPLLAAFSNAVRDIELRRFIRGTSTFAIVTFTQAFIAILLILPSVVNWAPIQYETLALIALAGLAYGAGIWSTVDALRHHDAGYIVPFKYSGVLWSGLLGFLIWHDVPSIYQMIGAGVLIAAGIYLSLSKNYRD